MRLLLSSMLLALIVSTTSAYDPTQTIQLKWDVPGYYPGQTFYRPDSLWIVFSDADTLDTMNDGTLVTRSAISDSTGLFIHKGWSPGNRLTCGTTYYYKIAHKGTIYGQFQIYESDWTAGADSSGTTEACVVDCPDPDKPCIVSAGGTYEDGDTVTLLGANFGSHTMKIASSVGPNGWIETNSHGTNINAISGGSTPYGDWKCQTGTSSLCSSSSGNWATISNTRAFSGSNSVDSSMPTPLDAGWTQRPVMFRNPDGFTHVYVSYRRYIDPLSWTKTPINWKEFVVAAPAPHHSGCGPQLLQAHLNGSPTDPGFGWPNNVGLSSCPGTCTVGPYSGTRVACQGPYYNDPFHAEPPGSGQHGLFMRDRPDFGFGVKDLQQDLKNSEWARWEHHFWGSSSMDVFDAQYSIYLWTRGAVRRQVINIFDYCSNSNCCDWEGSISRPIIGQGIYEYVIFQGSWFVNGGDTSGEIFWDDLYVQFDTESRVELGDNADYDLCTDMVIQTPTIWNGSTIEIELNHGGYSSAQTRYLFVVKDSGVRGPGAITVSDGFPITLQ